MGWPARAAIRGAQDALVSQVIDGTLYPYFQDTKEEFFRSRYGAETKQLTAWRETGLYLAGDYLYDAHSDGAARAG